MCFHIGQMTKIATQPIMRYKVSERCGCLPNAKALPIVPASTHAHKKPNNVHPIHPPITVIQIKEYEPAIMT